MIKYNYKNNDLIEDVCLYCENHSLFRRNKKFFDNNKNVSGRIAVNNISTPSFESGAYDLLKKVFPILNGKKFRTSTLKPQDVKDKDSSEMKVYARHKPFDVENENILDLIIDYIMMKLKNQKVRYTVQECIDTLPKDTSAGYPRYGQKGSDKNVKFCKEMIEKTLNSKNWIEMHKIMNKFPVTIFHRFKPNMKLVNKVYDPNWKIRQILGTPFFIVVLEKFIFANFVKTFEKTFSEYYTVGLKKVQISERIGKMRQYARLHNKPILCGDVNGCDKSISLTHSSIYFNVASNFIDNEYSEVFKSLTAYFLRTPMIYHEGLIYSHGSTITGSWMTSSFTTFSVFTSLLYSYYKIYKRFPKPYELQIQGDDFILILDNEEDKFKFKSGLMEFNLRLRLDKSETSLWFEDIEFLGYKWDYVNCPDQTDEWIISKIMYPERFLKFDGPLRIIYRTLSIIINVKRFSLLYSRFWQYDEKLKYYVNNKLDFAFTFIDERNNLLKVRIPIDEFLTLGWRML